MHAWRREESGELGPANAPELCAKEDDGERFNFFEVP